MSNPYPEPHSADMLDPAGKPNASEANQMDSAGGSEAQLGAEQAERSEASTQAEASVETSDSSPVNLAGSGSSENASEPTEGKKRRILIGSQRDPTLFNQYKPKPSLSEPGVRSLSGRRSRPRRPKRPGASAAASSPPEAQPGLAASGPTTSSALLEAPKGAGASGQAPEGSKSSLGQGGLQGQLPESIQASLGQATGADAPGSALEEADQSTSGTQESSLPTPAAGLPPPEPADAKMAERQPSEPTTKLTSAPSSEGPRAKSIERLQQLPPAGQASEKGARSHGPTPTPGAVPSAISGTPTEEVSSPLSLSCAAPSGPEPSAESKLPDSSAAPELPVTPSAPSQSSAGLSAKHKYPVPNLRAQLSEDLAAEFQEALADAPVEQLLVETAAGAQRPLLEPESRHQARIVRIHREEVFVELGGREQGVVPLKQFVETPEVGQEIEVIVTRFVAEEGLYELTLPASAAVVAEWAQLAEGMLVEARVTGQNTGGLECEVRHIRGFIPISMVDLYRVQDLAGYVGQKFLCKVIECNPMRGNLVLSRRAVLEQEREEARKQLFSTLAPGQIREGVVRKLMNFGAFVDLGHGVDGLVPVSQITWRRINHPREVLHEGQRVQVVVDKVDPASGRISLSLRQLEEDPWIHVPEKYPPNRMVRGIVRKVMDYGAFVELEPGVEGLVHISELSHKKVWRTRDVVQEGQEVEVLILSVDPTQRRISLSIRQALPPEPSPGEKRSEQPSETEAAESSSAHPSQPEPAPAESPSNELPSLPKKLRQQTPIKLKGGLGPSPRRGNLFGLKW